MTTQPNRPRTLFVTRKWPPAMGGMETYGVEFARECASLVTLDMIKLRGRKDGTTPSVLAIIGFAVQSVVKLSYMARRAEIIHGGDLALWPLVWVARLYAPRARLSLTAHGSDISYAFRKTWRGTLYKYYIRLGVHLLSNTFIAANSRATANLVTKLGFKQVACVRPGVKKRCLQHIAASVGRTTTIHLHPAWPQQPVTGCTTDSANRHFLLFAGRLLDHKGCGWFINHVLPSLPNTISLKVAGTRVTKSEAEALDQPRVSFLGPVYGNDLDDLRRTALAVIVPNIDLGPAGFEGFGLSALEAATAGGIVLAADLHGLKDAIIHGSTGFLIPPGNAPAWRAAVMKIHDWPTRTREAFIMKAYGAIATQGGWTQTVRQTLRL